MATVAEWIRLDGTQVAPALEQAREKLNVTGGELVLDWSAVSRIDTGALAMLETLARSADEKKVKLVFRGVKVDVYRVLKLANLTGRFAFLT